MYDALFLYVLLLISACMYLLCLAILYCIWPINCLVKAILVAGGLVQLVHCSLLDQHITLSPAAVGYI